MSVSTYKNNECRYNIDKLEKVVYLINEDDLRNIHIDNGEAYIDNISATPLSLAVYNISLTDTDELDERYKFTHTLTFSMKGYANYKYFQSKYYAIVKTIDGVYWLVNPMFPCKVSYTYTLDANGSHTDFTLATISNNPTLRIHGINHATPYECGYMHCKFDTLKLNEAKYSLRSGDNIKYTNDGFKDVVFNKNSAVFTETFDGNNVSHSIQFNIKFDDYKSSWHYNLLELMNNKYAAIIKSSCGEYILTGFHFGLQPSFTVTANDEMTMDNIQINLIDSHDNGEFIGETYDEIHETKYEDSSFVYTVEYDGWECVSENTARYLLKKEIDALGNSTGRYMCLEGYTDRFTALGLNIVGTFEDTETFINPQCHGVSCTAQTSFPNSFVFNTVGCRAYSLVASTNWTLTSSDAHITVNPSSGLANTQYNVEICNTLTPTSSETTSTIQLSYCETTKTYNVSVVKGNPCFTAGQVFDISANAQYVIVPIQCCIQAVSDSSNTLTNISIQSTYFKVYVPQNDTGSLRTITLSVSFCDGTIGEVIINQVTGFERWVKEDTVCVGNLKCDIERKYTGTTISNINTRTEETRYTNCVTSSECGGSTTRWIDSSETTCSGGKKYVVQAEQLSTDGGQTWTLTGNKRLGAETSDSPAECEGQEVYTKWVVEGYMCEGTTKYEAERLYTSTDNINWIATDTYRRTSTVLETNSTDCGYVTPSTVWTYEDWRLVETDYICDNGNKYEKLRRWVSNDNVNWTQTDVYKRGNLIEENSGDCGYNPSITGNCSYYIDDGDTICDGYDKYKYLRKYVRNCDDCDNCSEEWIATQIYKRGDKIQEHSLDCGYIPSETYYEWREDGWDCNGYDKYTRYRKYISEDGNNWYKTNIFKLGDSPIETNSTDCGYVPRIHYEYQWVESDVTRCVGTTEYYTYKKQRRVSGSSDAWKDVIPTVYSVDGDGTMQLRVKKENSENCGYAPPIEPQYKYELMDIQNYWICDVCPNGAKPLFKWNETSDTVCVGRDLYYIDEYQVSYDYGNTWQNVSPKITRTVRLSERFSENCNS